MPDGFCIGLGVGWGGGGGGGVERQKRVVSHHSRRKEKHSEMQSEKPLSYIQEGRRRMRALKRQGVGGKSRKGGRDAKKHHGGRGARARFTVWAREDVEGGNKATGDRGRGEFCVGYGNGRKKGTCE